MKFGIKANHFIMPEATDTGLEPPPKNTKTLFNFMAENTVEIDKDSDRDINKHMAASCLPISTNPANFWNENGKEYPSLANNRYRISERAILSTPVERLFSIAGKVFTPARCRVKDRGFQQLMFIRCNNSVAKQN